MRTIERPRQFRKDVEKQVGADPTVAADLREVLTALASGLVLPAAKKDHKLKGNWKGYRECHVRPDLLLIYKMTKETLSLARLGTHSELFKN